MPIKRELYPENWEAISQQIRFERAQGKCEWCGIENHAIGARDKAGVWHDLDDIHSMKSDEGFILFGGEFPKMVKIVLTVAHLGVPYPDGSPGNKHDKMDCRPENLAALCQKCHLNYDRDEHVENAKKTRLRKRDEQIVKSGQKRLL